MIPENRRFLLESETWDDAHYSCVFFDQERRQYMRLQLSPAAVPKIPNNYARRIRSEKKFYEYAHNLLPDICDRLPPDETSFVADGRGNLISSSKSTLELHPPYITPLDPVVWTSKEPGRQYRGAVARQRLVELVRRPGQVDRVLYINRFDKAGEKTNWKKGPVAEADFTYYCTKDAKKITRFLRNLYFFTRMRPPSLDKELGRFKHVVVEAGLVVGYLSQAAKGPIIYDRFSEWNHGRAAPFRLAHIDQLARGIWSLNFTYGLVSMDLRANDIVIDQETGDLWFRSFSHCVPITLENALFDITLVYILVYEKVTGDVQKPPRTLAEARATLERLNGTTPWVVSPWALLDARWKEYKRTIDHYLWKYLQILFKTQESEPEQHTNQPMDSSLNDSNVPRKRSLEGSSQGGPRSPKRKKTDPTAMTIDWDQPRLPAETSWKITFPDAFTIKIGDEDVDITSERLWRRRDPEELKKMPIVNWYRPPRNSPARPTIKCLLANGKAAREKSNLAEVAEARISEAKKEDDKEPDWDPFLFFADDDADIRNLFEEARQAVIVAEHTTATAQKAALNAKAQAREAHRIVSEIRKATEQAQTLMADYVAGNAESLCI
ncbi:hypothetical protein QBC41DRAFT_392113 [Cercophora samala]|uniref:Uncharacterized protein n=1 Tax=Cercophora samala TaxID=330535 RepID=A0AA39ZE38_9PEZI|nr:hypothetical protein QBC41DRAFT_392113 [Cercophora samala]